MFEQIVKILVIDDERINIQLLHEGLSKDYTILAALNGTDGLRIAQEELPDLILLDIMLGDVSGLDVCIAIKTNPKTSHIPIIFVTAQDKPEDELKGLELGAVDYFRKPFSIPLVKVRIKKQIELKQKTELLEHLSLVDGLTGLANRRQFDKRLDKAISYVDRNHRGLSLLLIDIDFFKQYNDIYGHVRGDETLKLVARMLTDGASRPLDFVARYGGEEFTIILTDSSEQEGRMVAEKVRTIIENLNIPHEGSALGRLTISVGVSHVHCSHIEKIDADEFIEHADKCLYQAKNHGRNCVKSSVLTIN